MKKADKETYLKLVHRKAIDICLNCDLIKCHPGTLGCTYSKQLSDYKRELKREFRKNEKTTTK